MAVAERGIAHRIEIHQRQHRRRVASDHLPHDLALLVPGGDEVILGAHGRERVRDGRELVAGDAAVREPEVDGHPCYRQGRRRSIWRLGPRLLDLSAYQRELLVSGRRHDDRREQMLGLDPEQDVGRHDAACQDHAGAGVADSHRYHRARGGDGAPRYGVGGGGDDRQEENRPAPDDAYRQPPDMPDGAAIADRASLP